MAYCSVLSVCSQTPTFFTPPQSHVDSSFTIKDLRRAVKLSAIFLGTGLYVAALFPKKKEYTLILRLMLYASKAKLALITSIRSFISCSE